MTRLVWTILIAASLAGCDQLSERAGIPNPAKVEAEGKAIGSACRHAGRGLEDCYTLNSDASKSAVFAGWKEMNEYMIKNNMESVEPTVSKETDKPHAKKKKPKPDFLKGESASILGDETDKDEKAASHGDKTGKTDKAVKSNKVDKADKAGSSEKTEKVGKAEKAAIAAPAEKTDHAKPAAKEH